MSDRRSSVRGTCGAGRGLAPSKARRAWRARALPILCAGLLLCGVTASAERTAPIGPPEPSTPVSASPSTNAHPDPARRTAAPVGWYCAPGGCGPRSADPVRGAAAFAAAALVAGLLARRRPGRAR